MVEHLLREHEVAERVVEAGAVDLPVDVRLAFCHRGVVGDRHRGGAGVLVDLEQLPRSLAAGRRDHVLHARVDRLAGLEGRGVHAGRGAVPLVGEKSQTWCR